MKNEVIAKLRLGTFCLQADGCIPVLADLTYGVGKQQPLLSLRDGKNPLSVQTIPKQPEKKTTCNPSFAVP